MYLSRTKREGLFGFGKKAKQTTTTDIGFKDIREKINEISKANQTAIESFAANENLLNFSMGNIGAGCLVDLSQSIKASTMTTMSLDQAVLQELEDEITTQLTQKAAAATEKKSDVFGAVAGVLGGGSDQETNVNVDTEIQDITRNTFNTDNMTTITDTVVNANKANIVMEDCLGGTIKMHQEIISDQVTDAVFADLTKNIANSKISKLVDMEGSAASAQEDTTISSITDMISGIFQGYSAMYAASSCAFACSLCGCCVVLGVVAMNMSPEQMSAAGAQAQSAGQAAGMWQSANPGQASGG